MRRRILIGLTLIALALIGDAAGWAIGPAMAQERPTERPTERQVKREILALFDGRHEAEPSLTRIHKFAEMPLNHLGYTIAYWDVEKGLPDIRAIERYRGLLTWFEQDLSRPDLYLPWAAEAAERGLKTVILGGIGAPPAPPHLDGINAVLATLGLRHSGEFVDGAFATQVVVKDAAAVEFERRLDPVMQSFPLIAAEGRETISHLTLATTRGARAQSSVLVATAPRGGYAAAEFTISYEPLRDRVSWVLNPFRFFRLAFGIDRFPIPDVTTLAGRRIYFSHIDGDGWNNVTEIERYTKANTLSSEVVLRELLEPYPDLPVSVGLIAGDVDSELGGDPASRGIARRMFALPQVEVASHTHTHPYNWKFFEQYKRDDEVRLIDGQQRVERRLYDRAIGAIMRMAKKEKPQQIHQRYIAGSDDLPRTYMRRPFELDLEVEGALRASEQLAPTGKRALLYQWSGDTTPFEGAVRATREAGVRNINGGDSRYDMDYPSIAYVPPIGRPVGAERQIYAVNSNENTYTNDWQGPYYGFRKLEETVRNTDGLRRLKAFNVYYHMYSGERPAALDAVKLHLETARRGDVIPIAASHYAAIADSFYEVEIREIDADRWRVMKRGDLQTLRFDAADGLRVDYARSIGVIGENRHAGALYVTLDSEIEDAVLALRAKGEDRTSEDKPAPDQAAPAPARVPYLVESRWRLYDLSRKDCAVSVRAEGFGAGRMVWSGLAPGKYTAVARRDQRVLWQDEVVVDASERLAITVAADAINPIRLELACARAS